MSEADLVGAVFRALTGGRHDDGGGDLHAVLADEGWDAAALRSHARAVVAGGGVHARPRRWAAAARPAIRPTAALST